MAENKNLLITGGATRVGRAIAIYFADRGWNIAIHYFRSSKKANELKKILEKSWIKTTLIKAVNGEDIGLSFKALQCPG